MSNVDSNGLSPESIRRIVKQAWKESLDEDDQHEYNQLLRFIALERDAVLEKHKPKMVGFIQNRLLPTSVTGTDRKSRHIANIRLDDDLSERRICSPLDSERASIPRHHATIMITSSYATPDNKLLTYIPEVTAQVEDTDDPEKLFKYFDTSYRNRLAIYGPEFEQMDSNRTLDHTIERVMDKCPPLSNENSENLVAIIAEVTDEPFERINERLDAVEEKKKHRPPPVNQESSEPNDDDLYLKGIDSYRLLYCRSCFIFDCNLHGLQDKPSLSFQYELGISRQRISSLGPQCFNADTREEPPDEAITHLTDFHKQICKRFYLIFNGDTKKMSHAMRVSEKSLQLYIAERKYSILVDPRFTQMRSDLGGSTPALHRSLKYYNQTWLQQIIEHKGQIPNFAPCNHERICSSETCTCIENHQFCTKACAWGSRSPNFFRGCACKAQCNTVSCTCFAYDRECDPDLCSCCTCVDAPGKPASAQKCRNDNITMRRHALLLVAPSSIPNAGWGCFTKNPLKRGDFIIEYVGEIISQEEAERRGLFYDVKNHSSLFEINLEMVSDGTYKANMARFVNHSNTPNCEVKYILVNGSHRIGFYAVKDISAQREIFINYNYTKHVENDYIKRNPKKLPWMQNDGKKPIARKTPKVAIKSESTLQF